MEMLTVLLAIIIPICYGKAPEKIVDGENASILDFPYQVFLEIHLPHSLKVCGGVIIDTRHILTAAHCVHKNGSLIHPKNYVVITGTDDLQYRPTENLFRALKAISHPNYNRSGQLEDDIAILKVDRAISFNDRRKPASLPIEDVAEGTEVTLTGWGRSAIDYDGFPEPRLQKLKTTVISLKECQIRSWAVIFWKIQLNQMCVWSKSTSVPCKGDSGGPFSFNGVVVGIHSQGACRKHYPAIFTRVYRYVPWIRSIQAEAMNYLRFRSSAIGR